MKSIKVIIIDNLIYYILNCLGIFNIDVFISDDVLELFLEEVVLLSSSV